MPVRRNPQEQPIHAPEVSEVAGGVPPDLELVRDEQRWVSLTFCISLYTDRLLSSIPEAVLACYEKFFALCPRENIRQYSTENMKTHKPVTKRAFNMLPNWL